MPQTVLRARILSFHRMPTDPTDTDAYLYLEDGAIVIEEGRIAALQPYDALKSQIDATTPLIDHRPHLLMAGFIDAHLHFPQLQVIASWGEQLLDWLHHYVFPAEAAFADPEHCAAMAERFFDLLTAHGTTTAAAFCSVHPSSAEAYFAEANRRNMRMIGGKVMMDRNAPTDLLDTPQHSYDDSKALIERWHGRGRLSYAISPRFALTSTPEQLDMAASLAAEHPQCLVQTHLSETRQEVAMALALFPQAKDYLHIYEQHGLLGPQTLLGHCIHLTDREVAVMAESGAHPVFCPTSNLFLGSGCFDAARLDAAQIQCAMATDIGAGTSYSMLQTMNEAYKVLQLQRQACHPLTSFYTITRGNAECLGLADKIGSLTVGHEADFVVLNARATAAMALRMERAESLTEELFTLQILGDDRAVAQTYIAGVPQKPSAPSTHHQR